MAFKKFTQRKYTKKVSFLQIKNYFNLYIFLPITFIPYDIILFSVKWFPVALIPITLLTLHLQWFEERTQQIESLDAQLRKLHASMEGLVNYRRELATSTAAFAKATAVLSSVEEHSSLSRALHQLSESTERTQTIHHAQVMYSMASLSCAFIYSRLSPFFIYSSCYLILRVSFCVLVSLLELYLLLSNM